MERARKGLPPLRDDQHDGAEDANAVKPLDVDKALSSAGKVSGAAAAMDSERAKLDTAEKKESSDAGGKPSPAAQSVGTLLKMTGGMSPTDAPAAGAPAAASAQANKASAPAAPAADDACGSEKPKPANNTFEPLSHAPVGGTGTGLSSPVRMQENLHADAAHSHHLNNEAEAMEQQRNYASFKQKQAESASAGGHSFDPSTGVPGHSAEGQYISLLIDQDCEANQTAGEDAFLEGTGSSCSHGGSGAVEGETQAEGLDSGTRLQAVALSERVDQTVSGAMGASVERKLRRHRESKECPRPRANTFSRDRFTATLHPRFEQAPSSLFALLSFPSFQPLVRLRVALCGLLALLALGTVALAQSTDEMSCSILDRAAREDFPCF